MKKDSSRSKTKQSLPTNKSPKFSWEKFKKAVGNHVKENLVSYIAIAIAALTAFYTYGQVSIAEKSMKISNRPYVIATKPKINQLYFSDDNTDLAFTQSFSNPNRYPVRPDLPLRPDRRSEVEHPDGRSVYRVVP